MELLAPAGGFEQALVSIESGCDALYGGLKDWSARNRAKNLSLDEYKELMQICKANNVKFYLTINTLLTDSDMEEIEKLLSSDGFIMPDGILVADIGLYSLLREKFPEVELHASTQLAAYSIEDVEYYKSLGFKRVVLARELTLEEVKSIRQKTDMELEVFVYGNQCVVFSGNCLWGGLLHSGSGHRGRCIGACCDIYKAQNGDIGNYFWSCNIGLYSMVSELKEIGVDSIKIEGRVRPLEEVREVVEKFRKAINGVSLTDDYSYKGYLGGEIPPDGAFNYFNPENTYKKISDIPFTRYDYLVDFQNNSGRFIIKENEKDGNYVFTLFTKEHTANENNIRIRFMFDTQANDDIFLQTIDYINANGERIFYNCENNYNQCLLTVKEIYEYLNDGLDANIYECMSRLPANRKVWVSFDELEKTVHSINELTKEFKSNNTLKDYSLMTSNSKEPFVFVDNAKTVSDLFELGYRNFLFFIRNTDELSSAIDFEEKNKACVIFYQLPYLDFTNKTTLIYEKLRGKNVLITRFSQLSLIKEYAFSQVMGDYMLNIWNSRGAKYLKDRGICSLIGHPEITVDLIRKIEDESQMKMIVIRGGKIPIGYTRACFKKLGLCSGNCKNTVTPLENVMKGGIIELVCNNDFGYRMIFSSDIFVSKDYISPSQSAYCFINTDKKVIESVLREAYPENARIIYNKYI